MTDFTPKLCPKGHPVGTIFRQRRCSGKNCGEDLAAVAAARPRQIKIKMPKEEVAIQKRARLVDLPEGLTGDAAVTWSKDELQAMLPEAVAQIKMDLRYGSDRVKSEAADKVLKANGMDRREAAAVQTAPTIILNIGNGDTKAPWLERLKKKEE